MLDEPKTNGSIFLTPWFWLVTILTISVLTRGTALGPPLRYDEAVTYNLYASKPFIQVVSSYKQLNNHPLHSVLMRFVVLTIGAKEWQLRLPAFLGSLLLLLAVYRLGVLLFDRWSALLATALCGASFYLGFFSVNARGYTIQSMFIVLASSELILACRHTDKKHLLKGAALTAAAAFTIPSTFIFFLGALVWMISRRWMSVSKEASVLSRMILLYAGATGILTLLLYFPIFLNEGVLAVVANDYVRSLSWGEFLSNLPILMAKMILIGDPLPFLQTHLAGHSNVPVSYTQLFDASLSPSFISITIVWLAWFLGLTSFFRNFLSEISLIVILPIVSLIVIMLQHPLVSSRFLLFLLPFFYLLAAWGWRCIPTLLIQKETDRKQHHPERLFVILTLFLVVGIIPVQGFRSYLQEFPETGTFLDAPVIVKDYKKLFQDGRPWLAIPPASASLVYYLDQAGIKRKAINHPPSLGDRFLLIVPDRLRGGKLRRFYKNMPGLVNRPLVEQQVKYSGAVVYHLVTIESEEGVPSLWP